MTDENLAPVQEAPEPEQDNDETLEAMRDLFDDIVGDKKRLTTAAQNAAASGNEASAKMLREMSGTVLELMASLVSLTGEGMEAIQDRLDDLEDDADVGPPNRLDAEEAVIFLQVLDANIKMIDQALKLVSGQQREDLEALRRLNEERIEFTTEIGDFEGADEDPDPTDEPPVLPAPDDAHTGTA